MEKAILCVDDEEFVLTALSQELKHNFKDEFIIELAQNAEDALEILDELENDGIKTMVIISDWLMPGMKGDDFLIESHKRFPKVIKFLLTGMASDEAIQNAQEHAELKGTFLKPWKSEELINQIKIELRKIDE